MEPEAAAQPPPPPPTDTIASPVHQGPLSTAPRRSSAAKSRLFLPQARASDEIGHWAGLFQVAEAFHGLILSIIKGHVKALVLPVVHPHHQCLHPDHDVELA